MGDKRKNIKKNQDKKKSQGPPVKSASFITYTILGVEVEDRSPGPEEPYIVLRDNAYEEFQQSLKAYLEGYTRVRRAATNLRYGKFGNWRDVGDGVREVKIDCGEGYRIYFGQLGKHIILILGGGGKSDQDADIQKAIKRWKEIKNGIEKH